MRTSEFVGLSRNDISRLPDSEIKKKMLKPTWRDLMMFPVIMITIMIFLTLVFSIPRMELDTGLLIGGLGMSLVITSPFLVLGTIKKFKPFFLTKIDEKIILEYDDVNLLSVYLAGNKSGQVSGFSRIVMGIDTVIKWFLGERWNSLPFKVPRLMVQDDGSLYVVSYVTQIGVGDYPAAERIVMTKGQFEGFQKFLESFKNVSTLGNVIEFEV